MYKICSNKDRTFAIKTILQHVKQCPLQSSPLYWRYTVPNVSSVVGMLPGTHSCDGAQFSYRILLNLRVSKKIPNFLNSAPTSTEDALRLLSDEQLAHVLSLAVVARQLLLIAKRGKWQFVVKICH